MKIEDHFDEAELKIKLTQFAFAGLIVLSGVTTEMVGGGSSTGGL